MIKKSFLSGLYLVTYIFGAQASNDDLVQNWDTSSRPVFHPYNYRFATTKEEKKMRKLLYKAHGVSQFTMKNDEPLPEWTSLSEYIHHVKNQKDIGACTAFATTQAMEIIANLDTCLTQYKKNPKSSDSALISAMTKNYVELSPAFLYTIERMADGDLAGDDNGSTLAQAMVQSRTYGCCQETVAPFRNTLSQMQKKPTASMYKDALRHINYDDDGITTIDLNPQDLKSALAHNHVIVGGISVYSSFESEEVGLNGLVPMPDTDQEAYLGGHAVTCVGYEYNDELNEMTYKFVNSWGDTWGGKAQILGGKKSRGFFWLTEEFLTNQKTRLADDFHTVYKITKK